MIRRQRMIFAGLFVAALVLSLPAVAYAKNVYVSTLGNDTTGNGLIGNPYATVQRAVDAAAPNDTVIVSPGTFFGAVTMVDTVSLQGAGSLLTTLTGVAELPVITAASIGAGTSVSGFTITGGAGGISCSDSPLTITNNTIAGNTASTNGGGISCSSSDSVITSNTITNNGAFLGGGIYCLSSSARVANNTIRGNTAGQYGGGICSSSSLPTITGNTITGNAANNGGGIYCAAGLSPIIIGNTIASNTATSSGGGVHCSSSAVILTNNVLAKNTATNGGGIYCTSSLPVITNNTLASNTATAGGGVYCKATALSPTITNCILWDNGEDLFRTSATYSDMEDGVGAPAGLGNISAPPSFVDTETGDYHLKAESPCIDVATSSGAPSTDKDGVSRPKGRGYDMGAYETAPPTHTITTSASAGGTITPGGTQTVDEGSNTTLTVTAFTGRHLVDTRVDDVSIGTSSSVTFANVIESHSLSASFAINTYALKYAPGTGGTISGTASQTVDYDASGTSVTASPTVGYHFVTWSDGVKTATRTDAHVKANIEVTATFSNSLTLKYTAGSGGTISGVTSQTVSYDTSGTAVTAKPATGYHFVKWSPDNVTANPRTDAHVKTNVTVTATFAKNPIVATVTKLIGPTSVNVRTLLKLTGTVISATAPGTVYIAKTRLVGGHPVPAGSTRVPVDKGKFAYNFKPLAKGSWRFVATYSGGKVGYTTFLRSTSRPIKTVNVK